MGPCTVGKGIEPLPLSRRNRLVLLARRALKENRFLKFVPASGAATRLFPPHYQIDSQLIDLLGRDVNALLRRPKALIPFHRVGRSVRTAFEEHLWEAASGGVLKAHFTVPREFLVEFRRRGKQCVNQIEHERGVRLQLSFSVQDPATQTLALQEGREWAREPNGELLLRPGGHGALLKNLEATKGDLVFIKNIDNVPSPRFQAEGNRWRMALAGRLVEVQTEAASWLRALHARTPSAPSLWGAEEFLARTIGPFGPVGSGWEDGRIGSLRSGEGKERLARAVRLLDRPWRVCGMVRNMGEPGGGPFWVQGIDGARCQILETSQLGKASKRFMGAATHFNPVEMVVGLRDWKGRPFRLALWSDLSQVLVSSKKVGGREVQTLEHPGLWNGGMAHWNTLFMEVPVHIFHPVKTISDLLRPGHAPHSKKIK